MDSSKDPSIYDHEGGALAASYEGSGNDDGPARVAFPAGTVEFRAVRNRCAQACRRFNETPEDAAPAQRSNLWLDIVRPVRDRNIDGPTITHDEALSNPDKKGKAQTPFVKPPFHADYGLRLIIGGSTFINRGCMIMDTPVADIRIGNHCNIGPHCTLVGVSHETHPKARLEKGTSMGRHITIGDNVWLGANVTILFRLQRWCDNRRRRCDWGRQCCYQEHSAHGLGTRGTSQGCEISRRFRTQRGERNSYIVG
ncbi:trimeric LpxA-like protein [Podospora didyma]|uniref:Trimeric LpxA-like protein n=1 Tax=Podospora didyma TaxID=330526 RepID=A0AAE0N369_9PEZI|nr:trimeric LpxA-like protein [Podospora didyma]